MKYFRYLIILVAALFLGAISVDACKPADGCTGCNASAAQQACEAALRSNQQSSSVATCSPANGCSGCNNSSAKSACEAAVRANQQNNGNSSNSGNSNNSGNGNNGGGGGGSSTTVIDNTKICEVCATLDSSADATAKQNCIDAGCPVNESEWKGNITYNNMSYEDYDPDANNLVGCERVFGAYSNGKFTNKNSLGYFLQTAFNIIKYIVPIILIVLTMVDFLKAVSSGDKDIVKVATSKLVKRAIIALVIFLIPTLLQLVLGLVTSYGTCGIK